MTAVLVPNRFLFAFEFPLRHRPKLPRITGELRDWTDDELLPALGELDRSPEFAPVWACWSEEGISIATRVEDKRRPLQCDPESYWSGDNLRLCTDMRDTRDIKRGDRFCQQFWFLPTGGVLDQSQVEPGAPTQRPPLPRGEKGGFVRSKNQTTAQIASNAVAGVAKIQRAREDAPRVPVDKIVVASKVSPKGYSLEAHIPAVCLSGFDPAEHPRIGFYYILEDADHGQQHLTIGDDLNWHVDPSTWPTAVLVR